MKRINIKLPSIFGKAKARRELAQAIESGRCDGKGMTTCLRNGEHSWFNHSQDHMGPGYPPGITGNESWMQ